MAEKTRIAKVRQAHWSCASTRALPSLPPTQPPHAPPPTPQNAETTRLKMEQATRLISGLSGERTRWAADSQEFAARKRRLVGDCAVAAAFVSYCGPFNQDFRRKLIERDFIGCV